MRIVYPWRNNLISLAALNSLRTAKLGHVVRLIRSCKQQLRTCNVETEHVLVVNVHYDILHQLSTITTITIVVYLVIYIKNILTVQFTKIG